MFIQEIVEQVNEIGATVISSGNPFVIIPPALNRVEILKVMELIGDMAQNGYGADHRYKEYQNGDIYVFVSPD